VPRDAERPSAGRLTAGHQPLRIDEGEFAGWESFRDAAFNNETGPFYHRVDESGVLCAFRPTSRSLNNAGSVHGGCLLTMADFSMYITARLHYGTAELVTVALTSQFLGGARAGQRVEARSEIVLGGRSLTFLRGIMTADGAPVLSYSGTFKRIAGAAETRDDGGAKR